MSVLGEKQTLSLFTWLSASCTRGSALASQTSLVGHAANYSGPSSTSAHELTSQLDHRWGGGHKLDVVGLRFAMKDLFSLTYLQETRAGRAARRLFRDQGFLIHFAAYVAVNALLIVINLVTTPGKYWFWWPLLGWGLGIAGHAFAVLRRLSGSRPKPRT